MKRQFSLQTSDGERYDLKGGKSPVGARIIDKEFTSVNVSVDGNFNSVELFKHIQYLQDLGVKLRNNPEEESEDDRFVFDEYEVKNIIDRQIKDLESLGMKPSSILIGDAYLRDKLQNELYDLIKRSNANFDRAECKVVISHYRDLSIRFMDMSNVQYNDCPGFVAPIQITVKDYKKRHKL